MSNVSVDDIVKTILEMRGRKAEYAEKIKKIDSHMETLETELLRRLNETGTEGFKTTHGTVYKAVSTSYSIADHTMLSNWVIDNRCVEVFQNRLSNKVVQQIVDETGNVPPGVNTFQKVDVRVRKD